MFPRQAQKILKFQGKRSGTDRTCSIDIRIAHVVTELIVSIILDEKGKSINMLFHYRNEMIQQTPHVCIKSTEFGRTWTYLRRHRVLRLIVFVGTSWQEHCWQIVCWCTLWHNLASRLECSNCGVRRNHFLSLQYSQVFSCVQSWNCSFL